MVAVNKAAYLQFAKEFGAGFGAGALLDAIVEVTKFPVLNDQAPVGGPGTSNFELIGYTISIIGATAGAFSLLTGKDYQLAGVGKALFSSGLGSMLGINIYEHVLAEKLGIR